MFDFYKRYVLWTCRVMARIPGFRHYGRFMERCYTKRFWTTWTLLNVISMASAVWLHRRLTAAVTPAPTPWQINIDNDAAHRGDFAVEPF